MWYVTCDMWHVKSDTWHPTPDRWQVTFHTWHYFVTLKLLLDLDGLTIVWDNWEISDSLWKFSILTKAHTIGDGISNCKYLDRKPKNNCGIVFENSCGQIIFECRCCFEAFRAFRSVTTLDFSILTLVNFTKGNRTIADPRYGVKAIISSSTQIFAPIKGKISKCSLHIPPEVL